MQNPDRPKRRRGERKPLNPDQQGLAAQYLPMARALAKKFKAVWPREWEEFESAAGLALVEAAESFDPGRNVRFSTFARWRIVGALRDVCRRLGRGATTLADEVAADGARVDLAGDARRARKASGAEGGQDENLSLQADEYGHGVILGATEDAPVGSDLESADDFEAWMRKLPTRHAELCRCIYWRGMAQGEAAAELGVSQSRASCMHREAIAMLNGTFGERPWAEGEAEPCG